MKPSTSQANPPTDRPPIDLRRLQVFISSAKHLSFAASAHQLHLTPSAVSHAIRGLEEELGCVLFQRHGPRVTLSRAGIRLMPIAEEMLARAFEIHNELASIDEESRQLRVGIPEFLSTSLLPRVVPDFFECFPSFAFETEFLPRLEDAEHALRNRTTDLNLGIWNELPADPVRRILFRSEIQLHVAPFHRLARTKRLQASELSGQVLLIPDESVLALLKSSGLLEKFHASRLWVIPSLESVREFARMGLGIAVLCSEPFNPSPDARQLHQLNGAWPPIDVQCSAFWPGQTQLSWAAEAFLSFIELSGESS
ncbi:LysR family transcriptional regulator [Haloferula chungangensis]|uniref:LysR family transcriptional regulator n=1 Tax=Haloferula chungangensis TaxID=1048331 RepID=A0ABW2LBD4_9BACT